MLANIISIIGTLTFSNMQFSYRNARNEYTKVEVNDDSEPQDILDGLQECETMSIFLAPGVSHESAQELLTELKAVSQATDDLNEFKGRVKVSTNKDGSGTTVSLNREPSIGITDGNAFAKALELLVS